jgi:hypothetical protein
MCFGKSERGDKSVPLLAASGDGGVGDERDSLGRSKDEDDDEEKDQEVDGSDKDPAEEQVRACVAPVSHRVIELRHIT